MAVKTRHMDQQGADGSVIDPCRIAINPSADPVRVVSHMLESVIE
jgi:hypothetical protein